MARLIFDTKKKAKAFSESFEKKYESWDKEKMKLSEFLKTLNEHELELMRTIIMGEAYERGTKKL